MNKETKKLLIENNKLEQKLSKETNAILTDMVVYIRGANITEYNQEIVRRDITNMLIEGQERGLSAAEVIGDDYKAFCDAVIAEMPQMTKKQRLISYIQLMCMCFGILLFIWAVFALPKGNARHMAVTLGDVITAVLIITASIAVVGIVTKKSLDGIKIKKWLACVLFGIAAALCILPSLLFRRVIAVVPTVVVLIIALILIAADRLIDNN